MNWKTTAVKAGLVFTVAFGVVYFFGKSGESNEAE